MLFCDSHAKYSGLYGSSSQQIRNYSKVGPYQFKVNLAVSKMKDKKKKRKEISFTPI